MSIELHTIDNGTVQAINDGRLYAALTGELGAIVKGAAVTTTSGLIVHIASGWGVACGRVFTITEEDFTVVSASSGTQKGRVYVHIDLTSDTPISIISYAGASLPALRQDDLSTDGFIYEIELANYDVDAVNISNLVSNTAQPIIANAKTLNGKAESQLSVANADNANNLNGKTESQLSVANADNANNLGGVPANQYLKKDNPIIWELINYTNDVGITVAIPENGYYEIIVGGQSREQGKQMILEVMYGGQRFIRSSNSGDNALGGIMISRVGFFNAGDLLYFSTTGSGGGGASDAYCNICQIIRVR